MIDTCLHPPPTLSQAAPLSPRSCRPSPRSALPCAAILPPNPFTASRRARWAAEYKAQRYRVGVAWRGPARPERVAATRGGAWRRSGARCRYAPRPAAPCFSCRIESHGRAAPGRPAAHTEQRSTLPETRTPNLFSTLTGQCGKIWQQASWHFSSYTIESPPTTEVFDCSCRTFHQNKPGRAGGAGPRGTPLQR